MMMAGEPETALPELPFAPPASHCGISSYQNSTPDKTTYHLVGNVCGINILRFTEK